MKVFAYKNTIKDTLRSSSGGAFLGVVSAFWNSMGGTAVYGSAFDKDLKVAHRRVTELQDCYIFCGSKYVESSLKGIYPDVANDLDNGMSVIFTGTPCQVNALNFFLSRKQCNIERLLTIDVICHGTPSAQLWEDYKNWLESKYHSRLIDYSFRYKGDGKKQRMKYPVRACFENGEILEDTFLSRLYIELFFTGLTYRDSCYSCKFSSSIRCSDITLADFWEYKPVLGKSIDRPELGMSMILANTEKGECIVDAMCRDAQANQDIYMEQVNNNRLLEVKKNFGAAQIKDETVKIFRDEYNSFGFEYILNKYAGNNLKGRLKHILKKAVLKTGLLPMVSELRGH